MAGDIAMTVDISMDSLFCKCQQLTGVLATLAVADVPLEDMRNAIWGAHALAEQAQGMAEAINWPPEA
ncbi:MAG: hypothetical protein QM599_01505 [Pseudoxanthomonas sp.]